MHSQDTTNNDEVIHKEKEAKRKLKAKGLLANGLLDYRTIGLGYHTRQEATEQGTIEQPDIRQPQTAAQLKNFEIDEYLYGLVMEDMITEQFIPFYAKACHQLGLPTVNRLKINALNGKDKQKLFAYKIKGALQLHYKRQFYTTDDIN